MVLLKQRREILKRELGNKAAGDPGGAGETAGRPDWWKQLRSPQAGGREGLCARPVRGGGPVGGRGEGGAAVPLLATRGRAPALLCLLVGRL